ncbi:MAG: glycosyltransferase family 4 protein [Nitrospiria bacterium]
MDMILFLDFISSLLICMALIPFLIKSAGWFQFMDLPGERKMHAVPIARVGGIAFAAGTFVSILAWYPKDPMIISYLIGSLIILFFGIWDDWASLNFKTKFLAQIFATLVVVVFGKVRLTTFPFLDGVALSLWLTIPFTIIALLGITNAINLSDGLDGLAGGLTLLSFGGLAFLAWLSGDNMVLGMVIPVLGGIFGFLRFNTYPARVFMGDGGSQFLGFSLGVFCFILTDSVRGPFSPLIALLIIGVPLFDTLGVMIQRWTTGRSLFIADRNHIHHKLMSAGLYHYEAVVLIYLLQIVLVSLGCFLRFQDDGVLALIYGGLAILFFFLFFKIGKAPPLWKREQESILSGFLTQIKSKLRAKDIPVRILSILVPLFLTVIVFVPRKIPVDFGSFSLGLLAILMGALFLGKGVQIVIRAGLYVGVAFAIYLSEETVTLLPASPYSYFNLFYIVMAGFVVLTVWTNKKESFQITPLDFLILFIILTISILMKIEIGGIVLGLFAAKLIILFYAFEILLNQFSNRLGILSGVSTWTLVVIGLRAWLS